MKIANTTAKLSMFHGCARVVKCSVLVPLHRHVFHASVCKVGLLQMDLFTYQANLSASVSSFTLLGYVLPFTKRILGMKLLNHGFHLLAAVGRDHDIIHMKDQHRTDAAVFVVEDHKCHVHAAVLKADFLEVPGHFIPPSSRSVGETVYTLKDFQQITSTDVLQQSPSRRVQEKTSFYFSVSFRPLQEY